MHKRGGERRDAIKSLNRKRRDARIRRHPTLASDARSGARGPLRISVVSRTEPAARAWVSAIKETIHSAASMRAGVDQDKRWVTAAFTWNGLRALGLDEASLASFPEEFKQGMAARAEVLGDDGLNAPEHWVGGLASPDLHAIVILFARDEAEHDRCVSEHAKACRRLPRRRGPLRARPSSHSAVRLRA